MVSRVRWIDFDCADPYTVASFWAEATGLRHHPDNKPGEEECALLSGADIIEGGMLFQRVPEGKVGEPRTGRRIHLDIMPTDRTRDEEIERLKGLGATEYEDHRKSDGTGWMTMSDPEGNLFCVERSAAERA
jgi:predicted enzyme related to lactoylglutathione lyase